MSNLSTKARAAEPLPAARRLCTASGRRQLLAAPSPPRRSRGSLQPPLIVFVFCDRASDFFRRGHRFLVRVIPTFLIECYFGGHRLLGSDLFCTRASVRIGLSRSQDHLALYHSWSHLLHVLDGLTKGKFCFMNV